MEYIIYILGVIIGIVIGSIGTNIRHSHGVLKINKSDPEKDSYVFEIDNLDNLEKTKWVRLRVWKVGEFGKR